MANKIHPNHDPDRMWIKKVPHSGIDQDFVDACLADDNVHTSYQAPSEFTVCPFGFTIVKGVKPIPAFVSSFESITLDEARAWARTIVSPNEDMA